MTQKIRVIDSLLIQPAPCRLCFGGDVLTLSQQELIELTGKARKNGQVDSLKFLGIPFKIHPDGPTVVLRASMQAALGHATKNQRPSSLSPRLPEARGVLVRQGR
ncbi:DUF4224 domain-containing protein [Achromobacter mucicolens]|uniref:DUF4224 domain-containing protein n=1 Tax=Achromobacter mucicolens TaxID=1389922 RepID=UPI003CC7A80A